MTTDKERIARLESLPKDFIEMKADVKLILTLLNDPEKGVVRRVAELEEVTSPLANLRKKMWSFAVGSFVTVSALVFFAGEYIKTNFVGK